MLWGQALRFSRLAYNVSRNVGFATPKTNIEATFKRLISVKPPVLQEDK